MYESIFSLHFSILLLMINPYILLTILLLQESLKSFKYISNFIINLHQYIILLIPMNTETNFKFVEVGTCKNAVIEKFQNEGNDFSTPLSVYNGTLQIMIETKSGVLMFTNHDGFMYGINPNDQVLYDDNDKQHRLVLCLDGHPQFTWIIKLNDNIELIYFVLSERCKFIHRKAANAIVIESKIYAQREEATEQVKVASKNMQKQKQEQEQESTEKMLIEASKSLGTVFKYAGKLIARGLEWLGSFVSKRVEPAEAIQVSEDTKKMINNSVQASNKILEITSEQFAAVFRVAKKQAIKISEKFEESEKGKELKGDGRFETIKSGVKTGVNVLFNLYGGFSDGVTSAGKGLAKGSAEVVGAKYGKDAGEASYNIGKGALNVYKIVQVPKNQAKKALKPQDQEEEQIAKK